MITSPQSCWPGAWSLRVFIVAAVITGVGVSPALASGSGPEGPEQSELRGAVYDSSGLPLIGALVAIAAPGIERPRALAISDARGHFVFSGLDPGIYSLMARSFGFFSAVLPEVKVPRNEPVRLQLRSERQVASLLSEGASLDLGWAFRPRVRDILRKTDPTGNDAASSLLAGLDDSSAWDRLGGELSLWTIAPMPGAQDGSGSVTDLSLGSFNDGQKSWVLRGQVADGGVVRARGDITRVMSDAHAVRLGVAFAGKDLSVAGVDDDRRRMWVGSVSAEDYWRLGEAVQVGYGLNFEHYNYLQKTGVISPRVQIAFAPVESLVLTTGVSYSAEAPGLAELRFQIDPLTVHYMDILTPESIDPERTLRYEFGIQRRSATTELRARAYHDEITDELIGIYLANPNGSSDYMVANIGDTVTQGFEVDLRRSFMDRVSGLLSYAYGHRTGSPLPANLAAERGLIDGDIDAERAEVDIVHELAAGLETVLGQFDTRLRAMYRWKRGVPVVRQGNLENVYERLDLRVRQPLPFHALSSEWAALVQVQNVLGRQYDGVFDLRLGDVPVLSRLVTGGLAVRF